MNPSSASVSSTTSTPHHNGFQNKTEFDRRYEPVDNVVNKGGFGMVRKYKRRGTDEIVAVKTVVPSARQIQQQQRRRRKNYIEREIDILRAVQHPNLLCLIDPTVYVSQGPEGQHFLMVTDFMEQELYDYIHDPGYEYGRPLPPKVRPQVLSLDTVKTIALQIGLGLQYLHSKNIVHRDLKLENVMVNSKQGDPNFPLQVKIIDFGISRELDNNMSIRLGSKKYMPPEVRNGDGDYSQRADMWSFGVILFVLLAQRYPFSDDKVTKFPKTERGPNFADSPSFTDRNNIETSTNVDVITRLLCPQVDRLTSMEFLQHDFLLGYFTPEHIPDMPVDNSQPETLMHIRIPGAHKTFRIILSTIDFMELDDPNGTVVVSIQNRNLPFLRELDNQTSTNISVKIGEGLLTSTKSSIGGGKLDSDAKSSGCSTSSIDDGKLSSHGMQKSTSNASMIEEGGIKRTQSWQYQSEVLSSTDHKSGRPKLGSLGKMLHQLEFEDGQEIPVTSYGNVLVRFNVANSPLLVKAEQECSLNSGLLDGPDEDPFIPCRDLFSVIIDTDLREENNVQSDASDIVKRTWHIYSSLRKNADEIVAGEDTNLYMSLIGYNKRDENGNELDDASKKKLCQHVSQEIANFAAHLTKTVDPSKLNTFTILVFGDLFDLIRGSFRALGQSGAMNVIHDSEYLNTLSSRIYRAFAERIQYLGEVNEFLVTYIHCTIAKLDTGNVQYNSRAHYIQICYWGGRVADEIKEMKQGYENARDEYDIEEEVQDRSAFILNEDHAIDILERNAVKVGKNSPYLESLEVFDAVITLLALEYILKNAPYLRG